MEFESEDVIFLSFFVFLFGFLAMLGLHAFALGEIAEQICVSNGLEFVEYRLDSMKFEYIICDQHSSFVKVID